MGSSFVEAMDCEHDGKTGWDEWLANPTLPTICLSHVCEAIKLCSDLEAAKSMGVTLTEHRQTRGRSAKAKRVLTKGKSTRVKQAWLS